MVSGSCLCGTVTYEVQGPFTSMVNCHCSMCRKQHGAPFATFLPAPLAGFRWTGAEAALVTFQSSTRSARSGCKTCGAPAPIVLPERNMALVPAGPLEGDLPLTPQMHIFVGSKAPWYAITDGLPQHEAFPPEFGVQGVERPTVDARPGVTSGSCLCGEVAFEVEGDALIMQNCHCTRCRRARGAAHGTNIFYRAEQFRWLRGAELAVDYKIPEAKHHTVTFCRRCTGALPRVDTVRNVAVVPAGCLDTDPPLRPQRHIFTAHKAAWFAITDELPQLPEAPPPLFPRT